MGSCIYVAPYIYIHSRTCLSFGVVPPQGAKTKPKPRENHIEAFGQEWSLFGDCLSGKFDCIDVYFLNAHTMVSFKTREYFRTV